MFPRRRLSLRLHRKNKAKDSVRVTTRSTRSSTRSHISVSSALAKVLPGSKKKGKNTVSGGNSKGKSKRRTAKVNPVVLKSEPRSLRKQVQQQLKPKSKTKAGKGKGKRARSAEISNNGSASSLLRYDHLSDLLLKKYVSCLFISATPNTLTQTHPFFIFETCSSAPYIFVCSDCSCSISRRFKKGSAAGKGTEGGLMTRPAHPLSRCASRQTCQFPLWRTVSSEKEKGTRCPILPSR